MRPTNLLPDRLRRYLLALAEIGHETHRDLKLALLARRRSVFLDVGANRGQFARFMASFYDRVVVFEKLERFEAVLAPNCIVHCCALADLEGSATFYVPSESDPLLTQTASLIAPGAARRTARSRSRCNGSTTSRSGLDFIEVDIEGAEFAFLQGAVVTLRRCRPVLLIEIEDRHTEGRRGASSMCSPASATGPSFPLPNPTPADRLPSAAC